MVWSIKLFFLGLIFITTLNSCESYARFFITNNVDTTFVVVKVNAIYNLPKDYISLNTVDYKNFSLDSISDNFKQKIIIKADTALLQYSFTQLPRTTVWLQPSKIGPPALQYVVINNKDTVAIPGTNFKNKSTLKFKSLISQKYLLEIN